MFKGIMPTAVLTVKMFAITDPKVKFISCLGTIALAISQIAVFAKTMV